MVRAVRPMYEPTMTPYVFFTIVMLALTVSNITRCLLLYLRAGSEYTEMEWLELAISLLLGSLTTLVFAWFLFAALLIPWKHRDVSCVIAELNSRGDEPNAQELCVSISLMSTIVGFRIGGKRLTVHAALA